MLLILDSDSELGKQLFIKNNFKLLWIRKKCLKQINLPISLYTSASISELPTNLRTMVLCYDYTNAEEKRIKHKIM